MKDQPTYNTHDSAGNKYGELRPAPLVQPTCKTCGKSLTPRPTGGFYTHRHSEGTGVQPEGCEKCGYPMSTHGYDLDGSQYCPVSPTGKQPERATCLKCGEFVHNFIKHECSAPPTSERERLAELLSEHGAMPQDERMADSLVSKLELLLREAREEAAHISNYYCDFCNNKMTNAELESHSG